ncbi:hypothetical protein SASPL_141592 [Salvia splendens]|uniref:Protein kinase domain-containing protein n=1 Tax=Salvia splendens TaxID=180675 RepID=A0A8X8WTZ3_SALSN|nr:hypothetical protein SASPL_141592 [Salvia splendens]
MYRNYDNWEKLVAAVLKREEFRRLALCDSFSTSNSTNFSFDSDVPLGIQLLHLYSGERLDHADLSSQETFVFRDVKAIEYGEIKKAIKNIHPGMLWGKGAEANGCVYKGWIHEHNLTAVKPGTGITVAIKKLKRGGGHNFLDWATRVKVAIGAARAISFLHDLEIPVIHRNIKCSNILLDGDFNSKLSGFGLAIDGPSTHVSSPVIGTYEYDPPEYMTTGHLTTGSDVYGFGAVLLQIMSGHRIIDPKQPAGEYNLIDFAKPYFKP